MDQVKIGKFIAGCRKEEGLTQAALAEKLGITDRAVSKWETGKSLPDASLMPELCEILGIEISELFAGEHIAMEDYKKYTDSLMLEMRKKEESSAKQLLWIEKGMLIIIIPTYATMIIAGAYTCKAGMIPLGCVLIAVAIIAVVATGIIGLHIEHKEGYYECPNCKERYVPTYNAVLMAPHYGTARKLKCPYCGQRGYHKKVISKEKGGE